MNRQGLLIPFLLACGIAAAFLREVVFANYFGVSHQMEVYRLAFSIPNLFAQSVASAFLGAVIPLLVAADQSGHRVAGLTSRIINVNLVGSLVVAGAGVLFAPQLAASLAPGFVPAELADLATQIRFGWVFFFIISITFGLRAVLHTRGIYWPSPVTPLLISVSMVVACIGASFLADPTIWRASMLMKTGLVAALAVFVMHVVLSRSTIAAYLRSFASAAYAGTTSVQTVSIALTSVILFKVSYEIPRVIDRAFGSEIQQGVVAALDYSYGIINVFGILFATSLVTVAFPGFSKHIVNFAGTAALKRYGLLFLLSATVATITGLVLSYLSPLVIQLAYARGNFDQTAIELTTEILKWHSLGLGAMVASLILSQALFAFRAHMLALAVVVVRVVSKYIAMKALVPSMGLSGLGLSFVVPEIVTVVLLLIVIWVLIQRADKQHKQR